MDGMGGRLLGVARKGLGDCFVVGVPSSRNDEKLSFAEGFSSRFPTHGAEVSGLESFYHAERFLYASADGKIVDDLGSQDAFGVDDKCSAEGDAFLFDEDVVAFGNFFGDVG